jgi:hypothetical protein
MASELIDEIKMNRGWDAQTLPDVAIMQALPTQASSRLAKRLAMVLT